MNGKGDQTCGKMIWMLKKGQRKNKRKHKPNNVHKRGGGGTKRWGELKKKG